MTSLTAPQMAALKQAATKGLLGDFLARQTVSFTGTMSMKREDLVFLLQAVGGRWDERITYYTKYLVVGDTGRHGTTKKISDARNRGTRIITEDEFVELLMKKRGE